MKKLIVFLVFIVFICCGYANQSEENSDFSLSELYDYQKKYIGEEIEICSSSPVKTYEDYRSINLPTSKQYKYIKEHMSVDKTGLLVDEEGFIGVALGTYFGTIGERYYFTLESGVILPLIIVDSKSDSHTFNGCQHTIDSSVIEFVIDNDLASEYFGRYGNGYILQGNFNNYELFKGEIVKIEKVTEKLNEKYVTYFEREIPNYNFDIFQYASGY